MINDITYINDNEPRYSDGDIYYYHGDHLGSATWITDATGAPVQYIQYLPTGEIWQNIATGNYNERFKFTGKEHDEESGYDYFGARYYWSLGGIWTAIDPLADKYPSNSPYMYCSGNPLKYVDPDGREKINLLDKTKDPNLCAAAENYPENEGVIHIWGHGSPHKINIDNSNNEPITKAEQLYQYLFNCSTTWQNKENDESCIIVLHACETGKGEESIAETLSASDLFKGVLIIAPSENVTVDVNTQQESGTHKTSIRKGKQHIISKGEWRMFFNGKQVNSFDGESKPIFKNPKQVVQKYEEN